MIPRTEHIEIVLTGGPSSGKTTSLSLIQEKLTEWGYRVFVVPEIATLVFSGCVPDVEYLSQKDRKTYTGVEKMIFDMQYGMRNHYRSLADLFAQTSKRKVILIYDRSEVDVKAYVDDADYQEMLEAQGLTHEMLRDSYDAVIHMTSVALAPEIEYQQDSNPQRREDKEMAIAADKRTLEAYLGHPLLCVVDASQSFSSKQRSVLANVSQIVGHSRSAVIGTERRFLVKDKQQAITIPRNARRYKITQDFLRGSTPARWSVLTKRETLGNKEQSTTYYRGDAAPDPDSIESMVRGRIISRDEYSRLMRTDTIASRKALVKERAAFRHGRTTDLEVDTYEDGTVIVTATCHDDKLQLPDWVGVEVSEDLAYQTITLGLRKDK